MANAIASGRATRPTVTPAIASCANMLRGLRSAMTEQESSVSGATVKNTRGNIEV